ncbi:MAG: YlxR family protein [Jiangellaceae bacterium]|nr:YlxR family protein [Jiangellaceae bacterium]
MEGRAAVRSPARTCVGCRARADKSDLLRVVAVTDDARPGVAVLAPDRLGRLPGRGAYLHPHPRCLELAERRRAFRRALRLTGPPDTSALRRWVAQQGATGPYTDRTTAG